jgi:acylphosphatase
VIQYEIKVSGRVQGVGFRYFAQKQAKTLNLKGWVRNTIDNGVLLVAQGEKTAIDTLADFLFIGPPLSQVKSVTKTEMNIFEEYSDFEVR